MLSRQTNVLARKAAAELAKLSCGRTNALAACLGNGRSWRLLHDRFLAVPPVHRARLERVLRVDSAHPRAMTIFGRLSDALLVFSRQHPERSLAQALDWALTLQVRLPKLPELGNLHH